MHEAFTDKNVTYNSLAARIELSSPRHSAPVTICLIDDLNQMKFPMIICISIPKNDDKYSCNGCAFDAFCPIKD